MDKLPGETMRLEVNMTKRKRRQFTAEFKADGVKLMRAGSQSIAQVAKNLDLAETAPREGGRLRGVGDEPFPPQLFQSARV